MYRAKEVVRCILQGEVEGFEAPRADCQVGWSLVKAAGRGHVDVARFLLGWPQHAPRADCCGGLALWCAAQGGHTGVVHNSLSGISSLCSSSTVRSLGPTVRMAGLM